MKKNILLALTAGLFLVACGGDGSESAEEIKTQKEKLGKSLFFDANLSLTRNTSCATCHDPEHGFVDARFLKEGTDQTIFINGARSVGDDGVSLGGRNAPTAAYAMFSPAFHFDKEKKKYIGGQFHDGRAATLKDQAMGPPLDGAEMMMPDKASVVERIKENPIYVKAFEKHFGDKIFDDINASYAAMGEVIGKFEKTKEFAPFDSKYDRYVAGEYNLTNDEKLGKALFFSQANTNCATCHQLKATTEAKGETFSNYEYHNIGTPKNLVALLAKDGNTSGIDHGLLSQEDINDTSLDGAIKVPTLRNIAITGPYMSNGVFKKLRTVLEFYDHMGAGDRPNNPETGQPWGEPDVNETINFKDLRATKELTDRKIEALEAFLRTLTDKRYEHLLKPIGE